MPAGVQNIKQAVINRKRQKALKDLVIVIQYYKQHKWLHKCTEDMAREVGLSF